jgi:hypothetical protein
MMTPTNQQPLKRTRPTRGDTTIPPPESLGVLEFSSALNSDDPLLIFHKLVHFVKLVRYERHVALSDDGDCIDEVGCDDDDDDDDDDGHDDRCDVDLVDHDDIILLDVVGVGGGGSDDNDTIDPSKRLKLNDGLSSSSSKPKNKTPSWKLDTNNYQVPFVGTSVAKGPTGTLTHNVWPTGFMEAYRKTSPYGVELLNNEYISALPSEGDGVHAHNLCKATSAQGGSSGGGECGKKKKPNNTCNSTTLLDHPPTRGQILSMAIQCAYWNAVSEWILGFISMQTLRNDLQWMNYDGVVSSEMNFAPSDKKCTVPPSVMTTLMKLRLPEWVDAIHNYSYRLQKYAQQRQKEQHQMKLHQKQQQQQQQTKKKNQDYPPEDGHDNSQRNENEKQQLRDEEVLQREAKLFLSSMNNLIALCHLSTGTAREVLRRLMLPTTTATKAETTSKRNIDKLKQKPFIGGGNKPGAGGSVTTPWMLLVFQNRHCSKSMFRTQLECLRLVCTLLETKDHMIISRLIDTSSSVKQGSGGGRSKGPSGGCGSAKNVSLAYVALQNGMQRLMDLVNDDGMDRESRLFARYIARLLRNVSEVVLPHSSEGSSIADKSGDGSGITEAVSLHYIFWNLIDSVLSSQRSRTNCSLSIQGRFARWGGANELDQTLCTCPAI